MPFKCSTCPPDVLIVYLINQFPICILCISDNIVPVCPGINLSMSWDRLQTKKISSGPCITSIFNMILDTCRAPGVCAVMRQQHMFMDAVVQLSIDQQTAALQTSLCGELHGPCNMVASTMCIWLPKCGVM